MRTYGHGWVGAQPTNGTTLEASTRTPSLLTRPEPEAPKVFSDPRVEVLAQALARSKWSALAERVRNVLRDQAENLIGRLDEVAKPRAACATTAQVPAPMVRTPDHDTSIEGAAKASESSEKMQAKLLAAYRAAGPSGLTDEEAGRDAGVLGQVYWKRCGELRRSGDLVLTGEKRLGAKGVRRIVSRISEES